MGEPLQEEAGLGKPKGQTGGHDSPHPLVLPLVGSYALAACDWSAGDDIRGHCLAGIKRDENKTSCRLFCFQSRRRAAVATWSSARRKLGPEPPAWGQRSTSDRISGCKKKKFLENVSPPPLVTSTSPPPFPLSLFDDDEDHGDDDDVNDEEDEEDNDINDEDGDDDVNEDDNDEDDGDEDEDDDI